MPPLKYKTVQEAYAALKTNPKTHFEYKGQWIIASLSEGEDAGTWSFTPKGHLAFPTVVKRRPIQVDGQIVLDMKVICGATRDACDGLVREFEELNERMAEEIRRNQKE
jgi:hypothetical protein